MRTLFSASVGGTIARLVLVSVLMPSVVSGGESQSSPGQPSDAPSHTTRAGLAATTEPFGAPPGTWTIDAFQADLFTGASTAQIPIVTPPGAGGVGPKIVLGYHSSTVDERGARDQAQGTGLGWTLDVGGFVFRDLKNTTTTTDDTFKLVLGGASHDLVLIDSAQNIYHTKDEIFVRIQYVAASDYWILTTKDGTQHRFGYNTDSKAMTRGQDLTTAITYKYFLDQATTTSGVAVHYMYTKQTGTIASNGQTYDQAVYPARITYAYAGGSLIESAREVLFTYAPRSDWTDTSASTILSFFEKDRLDTIEVRAASSLVRRYLLTFDYSIDRDPGHTWGGGATGDLTLNAVTIYGADGTSSLPPLSFSYTDARLSGVNNGLGGAVSFAYERVKATGVLYRAVTAIQNDWGGWTCDNAKTYLSFSPNSVCGGTPLFLVDSPVAGTSAALYRNTSFVQTGEFTWGCEGSYVSLSPDYTCGNPPLLGFLVDLPVAGANAALYRAVRSSYDETGNRICTPNDYLSFGPDPTCGGTRAGHFYAGSFDRYRVTTRSVSDGRGGTSTLTLSYTGLGLSSDGKEFRGHASVRAVDPFGHYTDTRFEQDDLLRGRPSQSQTRQRNGALLAETTNTWATTTPYPGVTSVTLAQTDVATCDDTGASCKIARQSFEFDAYGNPTRTYQWGDIAASGDERDEYTDWVVDATTWLHRPTRTALHDSSGAVLRERWLSYDGLAWGSLGARGLLTQEERRLSGPQGTTGNPVVTSMYDSYGNRTATTDARGCTTTTVYEASQTYPASVTTCLGHTTAFAYDARWGERTTETDPNHQGTTYTYDTFGRLTKTTGPLDTGSLYGSMSRFYLDFGNPATQRVLTYRTIQHGTATVLWNDVYFDGLGRNYLGRSQGPGDQIIQSETTFDSRGLTATQSAPHFSTEAAILTRFEYDARGRRTQVLYPDGTSVSTAYIPGRVTVKDQSGNVKRRFLDIYGRLTRIEEVNGGDTYVTTYASNAVGALVLATNHLNHVTALTYDLLGRKTAMRDPNMGSWTYSHDVGGNLVSQTDAENQTLTFSYDLQGRVLTKTYPGGAQQIQWTYDDPAVAYSRGRVTRIADLATVTTFAYDALGRVSQTQRWLDGTTYTMSQSYDALGDIVSRTFPDGDTATYSYNKAGWLGSIPGYITSITYNARGQQTRLQYANGVTSTSSYDPMNFRVTNRSTTGASGTLQDLGYAYDPTGNITQITDGIFTGSRIFTYDPLNRLTSATGAFGTGLAWVTQNYGYDPVGNLLEKAGMLSAYSDPLHPSAVTDRTDGSIYSYNANGSMLNGAGRALSWDADHRLTAVTIQGGNSATFAYDAAGVRVRKETSAGVARYPFAGYEIDPAGVVTKYLGGVAKKSTGAVLFYHNDHLGGVNVVTDESGTRVQLVEYDPWGQVSRSEGNADPTHGFTGKELDPETGFYYYGGRYYDAGLARFISADPFVPTPANPQSLNRYSYVLNNPVNLIDPSGYFFGFLGRLFKRIFEFHRKYGWEVFRVLAPIVVGVAVAIVLTPHVGPVAAGMIGGAAGGAVSYGLNGGDPTTSIVLGAAFGGIGGAVGPPLAGALGGGWQGAVGSGTILGGAFGGISAGIFGGDVLQGIAFGAVTGAVVSAAAYAAYEPEASVVAETDDTGDTTVRVGARETMNIASHKVIDAGDVVYEMGPDRSGNIAVYRGRIGGEGLLPDTASALQTDAVIWGPTIRVSGAALKQSIAAYESANSGVPYRWYHHNSNYFVNTVVSAAGGNPHVPGVFAPPFGGLGGPTPAIPFVWVPSPALRGE